MTFVDKNSRIVLKHTGSISEKCAFVENLYNKAMEKINHFDQLRQQHLNYAMLGFAGLWAYVLSTPTTGIRFYGGPGIVVLTVIFWLLDHRLHRFSHGFASSGFIFAQAHAYLLHEPTEDVEFWLYHWEGEKKANRWRTLHTWIYAALIVASLVMSVMVCARVV